VYLGGEVFDAESFPNREVHVASVGERSMGVYFGANESKLISNWDDNRRQRVLWVAGGWEISVALGVRSCDRSGMQSRSTMLSALEQCKS
jgi:hypothetical protein